MKWYKTDKFRKRWSTARLVIKLLLLLAFIVFFAIALNDSYSPSHNFYLYLSLGVLAIFLGAVIFSTHNRSND